MKTFNKTYLPEEIIYNGQTFVCSHSVSSEINLKNTTLSAIEQHARITTGANSIVLVNVLSKNLRGRTDLHGKQYEPTRWIFIPKQLA